MKYTLATLLVCLLLVTAQAQNKKVSGSVTTIDTADLRILNIFPDSFPNVAVVFKAETRRGEPVWNLTREKMVVKEDGLPCEVVSLEPISRNKPINLGIVIDHSGSMLEDNAQLLRLSAYDYFNFNWNNLPSWYTPPIENAKKAVAGFISSFNAQKDYISITGFSSTVDKPLPLTNDVAVINTTVKAMKADSMTALYDAMLVSLEQIKQADGVKVLVTLTDGMDNMSKAGWQHVIDTARAYEIPVYIIGLGNAQVDVLQAIAEATNGKFFYTQSSNSLDTVYGEISKQVQAFYSLVYRSENISTASYDHYIELSFDVDSIYLLTQGAFVTYPAEVVNYLAARVKQKEYLLYTGIGVAALTVLGTLVFYYRRRKANTKAKPFIAKVYPNPGNGLINIDYAGEPGELQIMSMDGQVIQRAAITGADTAFDFTTLQDGVYNVFVVADTQTSNTIRLVVQH